MYYFVYILQSEKDSNFYVGYTNDFKKRLSYPNDGRVQFTKNRQPINLVYFEGCSNQQDATKSEKYLKTAWAKGKP